MLWDFSTALGMQTCLKFNGWPLERTAVSEG